MLVAHASRPVRLRRSCLVVPGANAAMHAKATGLNADQIILDLEDAVAPEQKLAARTTVTASLETLDFGNRIRSVRINGASTPWVLRDLLAVIGDAPIVPDTIVVPKVQSAADVVFVDRVLGQLEGERDLGHRVGLELQVEDAAGLLHANDILRASDRIETWIFGPGDFAAALQLPTTTIGDTVAAGAVDPWQTVFTLLVLHARHHGIQLIDGPYARIGDEDGLHRATQRARAFGVDGKWVIHPTQIDAVNVAFGLTLTDFERACDLLEAYEHATAAGHGASTFGGDMVDAATYQMARAQRDRGAAQGLEPRAVPDDVEFDARAAWRAEHLA